MYLDVKNIIETVRNNAETVTILQNAKSHCEHQDVLLRLALHAQVQLLYTTCITISIYHSHSSTRLLSIWPKRGSLPLIPKM